jgi:diguanylate cyclase (GGDEF)-like protein
MHVRVSLCIIAWLLALGTPATAENLSITLHKIDPISMGEVVRLDGAITYLPAAQGVQQVTTMLQDGQRLTLALPPVAENNADAQWLVFALANSGADPLNGILRIDDRSVARSGLFWPRPHAAQMLATRSSSEDMPLIALEANLPRYLIEIPPGEERIFAVAVDPAGAIRSVGLWQMGITASSDRRLAGLAGILTALLLGLSLWILRTSAPLRAHRILLAGFLAFGALHSAASFFALDVFLNLPAQSAAALTSSLLAIFVLFGVLLIRDLLDIDMVSDASLRWTANGIIAISVGLILLAPVSPHLAMGALRYFIVLTLAAASVGLIWRVRHNHETSLRILPAFGLLLLCTVATGLVSIKQFAFGVNAPPALATIFTLSLAILALNLRAERSTFQFPAPARKSDQQRPTQELALDAAGLGIWDWDLISGRLHVDAHAEALLGLPAGALAGAREADWVSRIHPADRSTYRNALAAFAAQGDVAFSLEYRVKTASDEYIWLELEGTCLAGARGRAERCIGTLRDVTTRRLAEQRLMHDAVHDSLTGLPNRALFIDRTERAIARPGPFEHPRAALLLIDLDRFKTVNDNLGHAAGDGVLIAVARRLEALVPQEDTLAHLGGDEFAVLLQSAAAVKDPLSFGRIVTDVIGQPLHLNDEEVFPSASIGIAICEDRHERAEDLLTEAEIAMYRAKSNGRGRAEMFEAGMLADNQGKLSVETGLRRALERKEIELAYQPVVSLADGRVAGFEALMRWNHPDRGLLSPEHFLDVAEETGLVVPLGRFALENAVAELKGWQEAFPLRKPLFVSVNVSSRQLLGHDLVGETRRILEKVSLPPATLRLELTESLVMANPELSARVLRSLKGLGAGLSLDDFGTGYSSLAYLERYPFDTLKVDRAFIQALNTSKRTPAILRAIVALAHELGMELVAEGAESSEETDKLRSLGFEYGQGFYFGPPLSRREALDFIARHWRL